MHPTLNRLNLAHRLRKTVMKKQKKRTAKSSARQRRSSTITVLVAALVVAVAAITVASKQLAKSKSSNSSAHSIAAEIGEKYVTVKVAGRDVQVDPQTGQIKPLSPEEAQKLADGLKTMLNKSTDGLKQVHHADGSVSMDLKGRFQNVVVARKNADGTLEQSCVDEPEAAAQFFGIDPQLLGVQRGTTSRPESLTSAKKAIR
jgi:hypothetical protein